MLLNLWQEDPSFSLRFIVCITTMLMRISYLVNSCLNCEILGNVRYTLLFPIDTVTGLRERIESSPNLSKLFTLTVPSLRVASYKVCFCLDVDLPLPIGII